MAETANHAMQLLEAARQNNEDALGALLEMYRNYLSLIARLQISTDLRAKVSPSDLVQDTFLRAKCNLENFQGETEPELMAWLRRIMANRIVDLNRHYRRQVRDVRMEQQLAQQLYQSSAQISVMFPSSEPSPSEQLMRREKAVLLADALQALPDDYREILVLRHLHGLSIAESAERMQKTVPSVKNLWVRAVAKLRTIVESPEKE